MGISSDAGSIPAWSTKKESESSPFFVKAGVEQGGSKKHLWIIHFKDGRLRYDGGIRFCVEQLFQMLCWLFSAKTSSFRYSKEISVCVAEFLETSIFPPNTIVCGRAISTLCQRYLGLYSGISETLHFFAAYNSLQQINSSAIEEVSHFVQRKYRKLQTDSDTPKHLCSMSAE